MIDKLDIRIPKKVGFTSAFDRRYSQLRAMQKGPFRSSALYEYAGGLREYGHDLRLSMFCRMNKTGDHKIELYDVGTKTKQQILQEIAEVFDCDPLKLGVMHIDLAVDVKDVPLSWFRESVRVMHKRFRSGITNDRFFNELGNSNIQTLYFGKRPNLFRIYDKMAEYRNAYQAVKREFKGREIPAFESVYGVPDDDAILTRVERQMGARVPLTLSTLENVFNHASDINPFAAFRISSQVAVPINDSTLPFETLCTANYLRDLACREGMQAIGPFFTQKTHGNSAWAWKKYGAYIACLSESSGLTLEELHSRFSASISRQFAV